MLPSGIATNGRTGGLPPCVPTGDEALDVATTTQIQNQIRDLNEKTEDVRASVASVAVGVATLGGEIKALASTTEMRLARLERRERDADFRGWIERILYVGLGGGLAEVVRRTFFGG